MNFKGNFKFIAKSSDEYKEIPICPPPQKTYTASSLSPSPTR